MNSNRKTDAQASEEWKQKIVDGIIENLTTHGALVPAGVLLVPDQNGNLGSVPVSIPIADQVATKETMQRYIKIANPIAYMIFGQAKIHFYDSKDEEKVQQQYKDADYDLRKINDAQDVVVIVYEDPFHTDIFMHEIIKEGKYLVVSKTPMRKEIVTNLFQLFTGYLNKSKINPN